MFVFVSGRTPEVHVRVCVSVNTHKNMQVSTHTGTHTVGGMDVSGRCVQGNLYARTVFMVLCNGVQVNV